MNNRERFQAILHGRAADRMPAVHFGYTPEVVKKWVQEGHLPKDLLELEDYSYELEDIISQRLGFDFGLHARRVTTTELFPFFQEQLVETLENGFEKWRNSDGVYVLSKKGAGSIPAEIDHLLKDRASWETYYLPKLVYSEERFSQEEAEHIKAERQRGNPVGLHCGSLFGRIRDYLGIVGFSYLLADDEELVQEIFHTVGSLCLKAVERTLETGLSFDYGHFWEDMCYKNGSLVSPKLFETYTADYYRKITSLLLRHGIDLVSVDCDGKIDDLISIWLSCGVNTMFPIEVGTWDASIEPWRKTYGPSLRGIGGMKKQLFALSYEDIDREIERLKPLVALSGYIPCPDHRIPEDARFEVVQYYCEKIKEIL